MEFVTDFRMGEMEEVERRFSFAGEVPRRRHKPEGCYPSSRILFQHLLHRIIVWNEHSKNFHSFLFDDVMQEGEERKGKARKGKERKGKREK